MTELERKQRRRAPDGGDGERGGATPGRATLTSKLPPTAAAIARAVAQELVQAKGELDGPEVHAWAVHGMTGAAGALPFLAEIQRAFGHHDLAGVRSHIGGPAAEAAPAMGASAYASGDAVAFATAPDLRLAAHEAAHVVQQRGGVRLSGGVGRSGDVYERHADEVADGVVRGESVQALLDPFSHRGAGGGPAVQRGEPEAGTPGPTGVQEFDRLLLRGRPSPPDIVAVMRRHPDEAASIMSRVRDRLGPAMVIAVTAEVSHSAPELVPQLGDGPAHAPVAPEPRLPPPGAPPTSPGAAPGALGPSPASPAAAPPAIDLHSDGDDIEAEAHPDPHSTIAARLTPGADNPLSQVRVVVHAETEQPTREHGRDAPAASGELTTTIEPGDGRVRETVAGELHPTGERGPTIRGEAAVSAGPGDGGGLDLRGSAQLEIRVPVDDHSELHSALILTEDDHLRLEAGVDLLQRVRDLSDDNAARQPLIELFASIDIPLGPGGDPAVAAGVQLNFSLEGPQGQP